MEWHGLVTGMSTCSTTFPWRIDENILYVLLVVFWIKASGGRGVTVIHLGWPFSERCLKYNCKCSLSWHIQAGVWEDQLLLHGVFCFSLCHLITLTHSQPTPTLLFSSLLVLNYMCYILWFVCHWFCWHQFPHNVCTLHIMLSFFVGIFSYITLWMVRMCCMHRLPDV
jgi:hypothetical protein